MAYIRKRRRKKQDGTHFVRWEVRWRDPDGSQHGRSFERQEAAKAFRREVEEVVATGRRWEDPHRESPEALERVVAAYLKSLRRTQRDSTRQLRSVCLTLFAEWMKSKHHPRSVKVSFLKRTILEDYYDHLIHKRGVSQHTANDRIRYIGMFWAWAYDRDEYPSCPRPRRIELPEATPALAPVAPAWSQMDEAIEAAGEGWYRRLFVVLRYTGLRRGQAMELLWSDFDFERGMLTIRPELGKTKQERRGRVIPVSPHLLAEIAGWGRREGHLIDTTPARGPRPKNRQVHNGHVKRIWRRTAVPEDRYRQPCHCFRKGFVSELVRAGATERSVRRLVGHSGGVTFDVYTSAWAMEEELREAVALIPAVGASTTTNVREMRSEGVPEGSASHRATRAEPST